MFPPVRKPRKTGGAPFASATAAKDRAASSAPRDRPAQSPRLPQPGSLSARGASTAAAKESSQQRGRSADARHAPPDRASATTPCTERAEQYIQHLVGQGAEKLQGKDKDLARDWALVQELDTVDYYTREHDKKKQERNKRIQNVTELLDQCQAREREKQLAKSQAKQWREEAEEDAEQYRRELEEKRAKAIETQKRFNEDRKEQLESIRTQQRQRQEEERRVDLEMAAAAAESKRKQEEKDHLRKREQRESAKAMANEAKVARERKEQDKLNEARMDIEMAKKQKEQLEKQDRERAQFIESLRERQEKSIRSYEAGVGNELERKALEDEARARRDQEAKVEKERQDREKKERRLQQMKEAGKLAVAQQLQEHEVARQRKREEDQRYAREMQLQAQRADEEEAEKCQQKKQAREANAEYLRKQIQEKSDRSAKRDVLRDQMDEVERRMNREKLGRAKDPNRPDGLQLLLKKKRMEYRVAKDY